MQILAPSPKCPWSEDFLGPDIPFNSKFRINGLVPINCKSGLLFRFLPFRKERTVFVLCQRIFIKIDFNNMQHLWYLLMVKCMWRNEASSRSLIMPSWDNQKWLTDTAKRRPSSDQTWEHPLVLVPGVLRAPSRKWNCWHYWSADIL